MQGVIDPTVARLRNGLPAELGGGGTTPPPGSPMRGRLRSRQRRRFVEARHAPASEDPLSVILSALSAPLPEQSWLDLARSTHTPRPLRASACATVPTVTYVWARAENSKPLCNRALRAQQLVPRELKR